MASRRINLADPQLRDCPQLISPLWCCRRPFVPAFAKAKTTCIGLGCLGSIRAANRFLVDFC